MESRFFQNPNDLKIWVWLMLKASTVDRFAFLKVGKATQTIAVKRGQLIFGRNKAESELSIDGSTIYRTLQKFQSEQVIKIESNNQFSIITVNDFIESQSFEDRENLDFEEVEQPIITKVNNQRTSNEQPMNNQRTADEQATNTVEESLKSKESLKGSEGKKGENAPPIGDAARDLFGQEETNDKKTSTKPKKKKETQEAAPENSVYKSCIDVYFRWYKELNGINPPMDQASGQAAKHLISKFRGIVQEKAKEKSEILDDATTGPANS
jgi:hypothetical protein